MKDHSKSREITYLQLKSLHVLLWSFKGIVAESVWGLYWARWIYSDILYRVEVGLEEKAHV